MFRTETICTLYGPEGLEQFLGKEIANLINDVTSAKFSEDGQSFALGNHQPVSVGDLEYLRKRYRGLRSKTAAALDRTINEMITRGVSLIY